MPFVRRDAEGQILSLHRHSEDGATEFMNDDDPQVLAFVGQAAEPAPADAEEAEAADDGFSRLDADFIRVLEDLIDVLVRTHVINITDLPMQARQKLYSRKGHRASNPLRALNLLGDQPGAELPAAGLFGQE